MKQQLFSTWTIGSLEIKNRLVRSATGERNADAAGIITDDVVNIYRVLAEGGTGLIITGHAFVSPGGRAREGQIGIHDDNCIDGLTKIVCTAHAADSRILLQISHAGSRSQPLETENNPNPSIKGANDFSLEEIENIREYFIAAAVRAEKAGFDGIQIHGAHRYLALPNANRLNENHIKTGCLTENHRLTTLSRYTTKNTARWRWTNKGLFSRGKPFHSRLVSKYTPLCQRA